MSEWQYDFMIEFNEANKAKNDSTESMKRRTMILLANSEEAYNKFINGLFAM